MATFPTPLHLEDHEKVVKAFGYWPLFHDAEVRSLTLDRNRTLFDATANPCIAITVHALEWTEATASAPPSFNHHLVQFEFEEVSDVELYGFNHQNALYGVRFEQAEKAADGVTRHHLHLDAAHGITARFSYARGRVLSVVPCSDQGAPRW